MVACEATVPGIPNKIAGIASAVEVIAYIPNKKEKALTVSILKVKGSISAKATAPPRPGNTPTQIPIKIPSNKNQSAGKKKLTEGPQKLRQA
jgi:hypothetical protein